MEGVNSEMNESGGRELRQEMDRAMDGWIPLPERIESIPYYRTIPEDDWRVLRSAPSQTTNATHFHQIDAATSPPKFSSFCGFSFSKRLLPAAWAQTRNGPMAHRGPCRRRPNLANVV